MADTGLKSAGAGSGTDWTDPGNVTSSDDNRAIYTGAGQSDHYSTTFGFTVGDIPSGATIDGIVVSVEGQSSEGPAAGRVIDVALTTDGSSVVGTRKLAAITQDKNSDNTFTTGGSTDTWSAGLDDTDIVGNSSFGVMIRCNRIGDDVKLDHVQVTVYYSTVVALTKIVPTEDVDLTETTPHTIPLVRFASSTVGLTETTDAVGIEKLAFRNETVNLLEDFVGGAFWRLGFVKLVPTEDVDITEDVVDVLVVGGGVDYVKLIDTTMDIGETLPRLREMSRFAPDIGDITETVPRLKSMVRLADDTIDLTEDHLTIMGLVRLVSETGSITETVNRLREMSRFIAEGGDITETTGRPLTLARMADEAVDITETATRARILARHIAEVLGITETVVDAQDWVGLVDELVAIGESLIAKTQSYYVPPMVKEYSSTVFGTNISSQILRTSLEEGGQIVTPWQVPGGQPIIDNNIPDTIVGATATWQTPYSVEEVQEDPNQPDDQWIEDITGKTGGTMEFSFAAPTAPTSLDISGNMRFLITLRKSDSAGFDCLATFELKYNGAQAHILINQVLSNPTQQTWDYNPPWSKLPNPPDLTKMTLKIWVTTQGSGPARRSGDIGAVWFVTTHEPLPDTQWVAGKREDSEFALPPPAVESGWTPKPAQGAPTWKPTTKRSSSWVDVSKRTTDWKDVDDA